MQTILAKKNILNDVLLLVIFFGLMGFYYTKRNTEISPSLSKENQQKPLQISKNDELFTAFDNSTNHLRSAVIMNADPATSQQILSQTEAIFENLRTNFYNHELAQFSFKTLESQLTSGEKRAFIQQINVLHDKVARENYLLTSIEK